MKPKTVCECAIDTYNPMTRTIVFYASRDAANEVDSYGRVVPGKELEQWCVTVDPRFNYWDIVAFIQNYSIAY